MHKVVVQNTAKYGWNHPKTSMITKCKLHSFGMDESDDEEWDDVHTIYDI